MEDTKQTPPAPEPATPSTPEPTKPTETRPAGNGQINGLAIAAFVTGIISFLTGLVIFLGFVLGVVAIILGIISLKKSGNKAFPIIGIITGAIGALTNLVVTVVAVIAIVVGGVAASEYTNQAQQSLNEAAQERQALIDAKKDFNKGETATFAHFEVKVDKVTRNYVPENEFEKASDGKELIVVSLSTKNIDDQSQYIGRFDFKVVANGVGNTASYLEVNPAYEGGDVQPDATASGNIVFEVPEDAKNLKLQYTTLASGEELVYTLGL